MGASTFWAMLGLYSMTMFWALLVYPERWNKGYISRFQKRLVRAVAGPEAPTLRWHGTDFLMFLVIMIPFGTAISTVLLAIGVDLDGSGLLAFIIRIFDDVLNGEDDGWKKRWERAKNKVKWLWTTAMEPQAFGREAE